mgnify:CR=1 FL=1
MEGFGLLILVFIGWAVFQWALSAGAKTVAAAGKSVMGKGSFSENMELEFKGMGPLEIRIKDTYLNEDGTGPEVKEIEVKGIFPVHEKKNIGFITSVFDVVDGELEPVLSVLDQFQEPESVVYQHQCGVGEVEPNLGFARWVRIGVVIPDIIEPAYSGRRQLKAVVRMVDMDNLPTINNGFCGRGDTRLIWTKALEFSHFFNDKGYMEVSEHRDEATGLALKIGMAVAMADGSLDDEEGNILKQWIIKSISPFSDEKRENLKSLYNNILKESYGQSLAGSLKLSELTSRLNEIGDKSTRYETLELCFDVMAADGVADDNEMKMIKVVAESLNLDMSQVEKLRDQKIIGLDTSINTQSSIEAILGIDSGWSTEEINRYLRTEFQKWNNRLNVLDDDAEKENVQKMLNLIAEARKKYAAS